MLVAGTLRVDQMTKAARELQGGSARWAEPAVLACAGDRKAAAGRGRTQ